MNPQEYVRRGAVMLAGTVVMCTGACLAVRADLGVGPWDAVGLTLADAAGIKLGYIQVVLNTICVMLQKMIEGPRFQKRQYLQVMFALFTGLAVNLFLYSIYKDINIDTYWQRLVILALGYLVAALGVTIIMEAKLVRNPLEGVCLLIAQRRNVEMGQIRLVTDVVMALVTVILYAAFATPLHLREGTAVSLLLFGPALIFWRKRVGNKIEGFCSQDRAARKRREEE